MGDSPSAYVWPHNPDTANWCWPSGVFGLLHIVLYRSRRDCGTGCHRRGLTIHLFGKPITQPALRVAGLVLCRRRRVGYMASGLADRRRRAVPQRFVSEGGNGGVLGIGAAEFLSLHLARLGTWLVVLCCWIVGSILLADTFVFAAVRCFGLGVLETFGLAQPAWKAARNIRRHSAISGTAE